jgi:hypothetical protein
MLYTNDRHYFTRFFLLLVRIFPLTRHNLINKSYTQTSLFPWKIIQPRFGYDMTTTRDYKAQTIFKLILHCCLRINVEVKTTSRLYKDDPQVLTYYMNLLGIVLVYKG